MLVQVACFFIAFSYVVSLYMIPAEIRKRRRDDPLHIQYRLIFSTFSTISSVVLLYFLSSKKLVTLPGDSFLESIGFKLDRLLPSVVISFVLMIVFYLGPVTVHITMLVLKSVYKIDKYGVIMGSKETNFVEEFMKQIDNTIASVNLRSQSLQNFRNLIFAPISEEIAFRALMIPLLFSVSTTSPVWLAVFSPIWFALAHVHHIYEKIRDGSSVVSAFVTVMVQLTYTSIFGVIAALMLMRTYSIAGPIVSHMICNICGLPCLDFMTAPPREPVSLSYHRMGSDWSVLYPYRYFLLFLHGFGLLMFSLCIFPFTETYAAVSPLWAYN